MESRTLYRVQKEDLPKMEELLTQCFARDPLYCKLIPDEETRKRLLPELFKCDLSEFFELCQIYSDSPELNSIIVVSDESEPYDPFRYYLTEALAALKTDEYLIREDPSLKTFWNFVRGKDYLNSRWTAQLHQEERLHIIYLAVRQAAPRPLGPAAKRGDRLRREPPPDDFPGNPQSEKCPAVRAFRIQGIRRGGKTFRSQTILPGARGAVRLRCAGGSCSGGERRFPAGLARLSPPVFSLSGPVRYNFCS